MESLFDRRLIFVTGKGGVGKSTVATALGLVAARGGLRTIVAELAGQERVQQAFERQGETFTEVELAPGLFTISIDPQHAMEEYLHLRVGALGNMLASSRLFGAFAMATPGLRELLSIGKIWELAQLERRTRGAASYDLVIVDAPATGHGMGILRTPRTFAEIARVGPIAHQGTAIAQTIADPQFTAIVAVTTAEEMPVNETLTAARLIAAEGLALSGVVVNALYPERFSGAEIERLRNVLVATDGGATGAAGAAMRAAVSEHGRACGQRAQLERLRAELPAELVELPYLFVPEIGLAELEQLADRLEPAVGSTLAA
ncbi:MAG TPA: ArsA family ATPase [Solirubrobacteraceae bacterium]|nr:ArsA family ATPase [Solirubrobacteraceae bacterium]